MLKLKQTKAKRKYKDSLFVHLFSKDKDWKKNFIDLYNALNDTHLDPTTTKLKDVHIEGVLYAGQENDVSMLVDDKIVLLCEQQSTVNYNMPLRCLMYVAKIYEQQMDPKARFHRTTQRIPAPQFFVFYNGLEKQPAVQVLHLKDAFTENDTVHADATLSDLTVTVYNINEPAGKEKWEQCTALRDYSMFVRIAREENATNPDGFMERAVRRAIKAGILADYLRRHAREIENMFFGEYDYETDIAVQREEAYDKGIAEGAHDAKLEAARNALRFGLTKQQAAQISGLTEDEVQQLAAETGK